jgi:hypothetical protein
MKVIIVLSALVCCAYAQTTTVVATPLKEELLRRATFLDSRIKLVIKALEAEKREHLAQLLQEEEKRLETVTNNLKAAAPSDVVRIAILEDELITLEYRVENEIVTLQREKATQELLLSNARILREWVTEEIKLLEASTDHKEQSMEIANELRRAENRLGEIAHELTLAQDQRQIERTEVELRVIEVRLYEALRRLHLNPATGTPPPSTTQNPTGTTPSPRPTTAAPITTPRPTTGAPVTTPRPTTGKPAVTTVKA